MDSVAALDRRLGRMFHEEKIGEGGAKWAELRRQEVDRVSSVGNPRSLEASSQCVLYWMTRGEIKWHVPGTRCSDYICRPVVRWCSRTLGRGMTRKLTDSRFAF